MWGVEIRDISLIIVISEQTNPYHVGNKLLANAYERLELQCRDSIPYSCFLSSFIFIVAKHGHVC